MLTNTHLFQEAGNNFRKNKSYIRAIEDSYQYREYWDEEWKKCTEGITIGNLWIPGTYYYYLNYVKISRSVDDSERKVMDFPQFTDVDLEFFLMVEKARKEEKGVILVKPRRIGFSYKLSALAEHEFTFYENTNTVLSAYTSFYAENLMKFTKRGLGFLDEHTAWGQQRTPDTIKYVQARYLETPENAASIWKGTHNEIKCITFKDNPYASASQSASLFIMDECMSPGTKVWMSDLTLKNIEDIKVGDYTLGIDGTAKKVISTTSGKDEMFKVSQQRGIEYVVNSKHKLYLEQRCRTKQYKDDGIKILTPKEIQLLPTYKKQTTYGRKADKLEFPEVEVPIEPYYLGAWLGDGDKDSTSIVVNIEKDLEIKDYIYDYAKRLDYKVLVGNCSATDKCKTFVIQKEYYKPNPLLYKIKDLGIHKNKRIPKQYIQNSLEVRLEVLAGLLDTDGCLLKSTTSNSWRYEISCTKKDLAEDIELLARTCGFYVTTRKIPPKTPTINGKIVYSKESIKIAICGEVYKIPVKVKRKKPPIWWNRLNKTSISKINIEPVGIGDYYGFTLEGDKEEDHLFLLEDFTITHNCGIFPNIIESYGIAEPTWKDGDKTTGLVIIGGSAGSMESGSLAFSQMFYNPGNYNLLAFDNIWDDGKENTKCGWFVPASRMRFGEYKDVSKKLPHRNGQQMVDINGNSIEDLAHQSVMDFREKKKGNEQSYKDALSQYPLNTQEAFLRSSGVYFPAQDLQYRLSDIENDKIFLDSSYVGDLVMVAESKFPELRPSTAKPIRSFLFDGKTPIEGAIEIWEKPQCGSDGRPPYLRYIIGVDPVDSDDNDNIKNSLQSTLVFDLWTDRIVAEYTGRTKDTKVYYENVRRLALYYNALTLYENAMKGLFGHFKNVNSTHLLADVPSYLKDSEMVKASTEGNRGKGCPMNTHIKKHAEDLTNTWLLSPAQDKEEGILNVHIQRGIAFIKELIYYDRIVNTDRVSALFMVMILREELSRLVDKRREPVKSIFDADFFSRHNVGRSRIIQDLESITDKDVLISEYKKEYLFEI